MARPLRLEFAGALYHITSRGDRRDTIYRADDDREAWLEVRGNGLCPPTFNNRSAPRAFRKTSYGVR